MARAGTRNNGGIGAKWCSRHRCGRFRYSLGAKSEVKEMGASHVGYKLLNVASVRN